MAEAHPDITIIPTVLFSDRRKWRKDVDRTLKIEFKEDGADTVHDLLETPKDIAVML